MYGSKQFTGQIDKSGFLSPPSKAGGGQGPYCPLSSPLCTRLRDEVEGMDDERGTLDI